MVLGAIIGGAIGIGTSIFGASQANNQAKAQDKAAKAQIENTYKAQMADWEFNKASNTLAYDYAKASNALTRDIERATAVEKWQLDNALDKTNWIIQSTNLQIQNDYTNASNQRDVDFQRTLQAADYRASMRSYQESERTYSINTQLISQAVSQAYEYNKQSLVFERQGMMTERLQVKEKFDTSKKDTINQAKQSELKYKNELRQAGYTGEDLQRAVKQKMAEFTKNQDLTRRKGNAESGAAAASGRQGGSAYRVMMDPLNQASMTIGALGIELAFYGEERQSEMLKLAAATNLAGVLTDQEREKMNIMMQSEQTMADLALDENHRKEQQAIYNTNNSLDDEYLQGQSLMNQADANRELRPMPPVGIQDALVVPKTFMPKPFARELPLAADPKIKPLEAPRPLTAPKPTKGSAAAPSGSPGTGILLNGIAQAGLGIANAFLSQPIATVNTPTPAVGGGNIPLNGF